MKKSPSSLLLVEKFLGFLSPYSLKLIAALTRFVKEKYSKLLGESIDGWNLEHPVYRIDKS